MIEEQENYYKKKIFYLCAKRGMKENELLLTSFAEKYLDQLTVAECDTFEQLLNCPDADLLNWLSNAAPVPPHFDTPLFKKLLKLSKEGPI
jgi:antitoxin CptB